MLGFYNVITSWSRAVYDPVTGLTKPNQITYANQPAHVDIIPSTSFHELPTSARKSVYLFIIDAGVDIVTGDMLETCVDLLTSKDWPLDYPTDPSQPGFQNTIWMVRFHHESAAGPGAYRALYLEKVQVGGPSSPY